MANAKVETITKTVETQVDEEAVTLTMSREEAKVLRALTGIVTGAYGSSYRKHTNGILNALETAGVSAYGYDYFKASIEAKLINDKTF